MVIMYSDTDVGNVLDGVNLDLLSLCNCLKYIYILILNSSKPTIMRFTEKLSVQCPSVVVDNDEISEVDLLNYF